VTLTATNSIAPFQWSATALPSGLTLNASTGAVTGTPNGAGTFGFIIRATGADALFTDQTFSLSVGAVADTLLAQQWHLEDSGVEMAGANVRPAWPTSRGAGVVIGIVDDGVQWTHPDLQANYDVTLSHDYDGHDHDASPRTSGACGATADCRGTSAAGIAAARSDNGVGGSGVAPLAAIAGIRLGENAADADVASAISHQLSGIHVENHSWLRPDDGQTLAAPGPLAEAALTNAIAQGRAGAGRVFVWAAGDGRAVGDNCNFDGYANSRFGIAVGAVDETGRQAPYSESCSALLVSAPSSGAPGVHRGLTTTDLLGSDGNSAGDYTSAFGGTSAAAPVVSGVAALMLARNPALTWRDVQHILVRSGRQVDAADPGWTAGVFPHSERYGFGIVDALAAVTRAGTWTNVAAESAVPPIARAVGTTIPDNDATGVSDSVSVGPEYAGFSIEHVEVEFNATHPHRGDLEVTLISPSGDVSHLGTVRPADAAANFTGWRFRSVRHWGQSPVGTWRLQVADRAAGGTGIWNAWTLRIHGLAPPPPAPVPPSGGGSSGGGGGGGSAPAPPAADPAPSGLGAPVGLSGTVSGTTVVLSWAPPATGVTPTTYILEAGSAPGASNVIVYNTGSAATSYTATGVGAGIYYVRVRASHGGTTGVASNEITFRIGAGAIPPSAGGPPGPPLGLAARTSGSNLTLSWSVPALGARPTTYIVEAGSGPGRSDLATFSTGNAVPSLSAPGLGAGTYFVRVRAANSAGVSAPSNEVVFAVGGAPVPTACSVAPGAPGGLRSSVHGSTVTLEWNAASGGPTSYVVEAGSSSGRVDLVVSDTGNAGTSLVATGVGVGSYFVRMRAHNGCGAGAASNEVIVVVR
jgi:subtilisin-like proprotein convertase family protein